MPCRMTDYALQMAYGNFSAALLHFGGQGTYYNVSTLENSFGNHADTI